MACYPKGTKINTWFKAGVSLIRSQGMHLDTFSFEIIFDNTRQLEISDKTINEIHISPLFDRIDIFWSPLHWRHNDHGGVSNHQPRGCLLNRLFRRRWKKTSKLRVTGLCAGNSPEPVNYPHKGQVMRKIFPFDDVIMHVGCTPLRRNVIRAIIFSSLGRNRRSKRKHFCLNRLIDGSIMA